MHKDELKFADIILNNIHKLSYHLKKEQINYGLNNYVEKLNNIYNKQF